MKEILRGAKILITGGAGSVGRVLTSQVLQFSPEVIRIYDISENEMFRMRSDFSGEERLRYLIGDIRDTDRLKLAMEDIDIVVHLAAMKHVYACEYNPFEAVKINIDGLQNVINVARSEKVQKVIFSSTDKAACPSNVMGMTKLLGEKLISLANNYSLWKNTGTVFASIRFGNVIGSNGSVIPLFKKQILSGGPVTITDKQMTRFVITMDEAIKLIYSAIRLAKGAETFVWKMRTLKVVDIAKVMVDMYSGNKAIRTVIKGKGEGEKIHEEIMSEEELHRSLELEDLYVIFPEIDYSFARDSYKQASPIKDPVIASNMGTHMGLNEIRNLLAAN